MHHLDRVTITGADNSVDAVDLLALSEEFPFVEWGILISKNSMGTFRFPTLSWLWTFNATARSSSIPVAASMHVCGRWLRELLGRGTVPSEIIALIDCFQRVQLNFHAEGIACNPASFRNGLKILSDEGNREFIFQIDGNRGREYLAITEGQDYPGVPLFDVSHGAGVLARSWPAPLKGYAYQGYAGGLGPDNLAEQIPLIGEAAGETRIWIDMETRVRSDDNRQFNLAKVRRCLEIAAPFIREKPHAEAK